MKKIISLLMFGFLLASYSFSQSWSAGTGFLYANPTTTKVGIGLSTTPFEQLHIYNPTAGGSVGIRLNGTSTYYSSTYYHHWNIVYVPGSTTGELKFNTSVVSGGSNANPSSWTTAFTFGSTGTLSALGGLVAPIFADLNNNAYYLDPSNTTLSLKVAGKIQTCGKIEAEEIEVKNVCAANISVKMDNLADYVFNEDYSRMSLYDLEQFINANKHLPGVPSAEEVKDKGMDVAEMNNLLLEKVEELTLYVLELQKQIDELKK